MVRAHSRCSVPICGLGQEKHFGVSLKSHSSWEDPQTLLLALPAQPLMSPEVTGTPHIRGIRAREETGEKRAGLGANERALEEPNLCMLPAWQEGGVDSS